MSSIALQAPSKAVAFTIHLFLSVLIFLTLIGMMWFYWFPGQLFFLDGGWQGVKLVALVDLVLGPALTLILYKPGKPKLVLDLSLIAFIQIAALVYGFYVTHQQRTVAIVFAENAFYTVSADDHIKANQSLTDLSETPQTLPKSGFMQLPILVTPEPGPDNYEKFLQQILNGYPGPQLRSDLYVSVEAGQATLQRWKLGEEAIAQSGITEKLATELSALNVSQDDIELYTFKARYSEGIAVFQPEKEKILSFIPNTDERTVAESDLES